VALQADQRVNIHRTGIEIMQGIDRGPGRGNLLMIRPERWRYSQLLAGAMRKAVMDPRLVQIRHFDLRPEGPQDNGPGRKAGIKFIRQ
jgi:hypothetical protein